MTPNRKALRGLVFFVIGILLLYGCASIDSHKNQIKEEYLAAAGFKIYPANGGQEEENLKKIPQRQLVSPHGAKTPTYIYADNEGCHCLYVGDEKALDEYHRLAGIKRNTDNALIAADMRDTFAMGMFSGSAGWGGI